MGIIKCLKEFLQSSGTTAFTSKDLSKFSPPDLLQNSIEKVIMNLTGVNNLIKIRALMEKLSNDQDKVINKSFEKKQQKETEVMIKLRKKEEQKDGEEGKDKDDVNDIVNNMASDVVSDVVKGVMDVMKNDEANDEKEKDYYLNSERDGNRMKKTKKSFTILNQG
ncbi:15499_t:CDS:2 [Entrophospora sp. SA101]|nr:15499_t:CDS:2 [Entrophospora sp. SA101]CAJ0832748.1 1146_t:CDS:2 [Entrophospora sp. SA101]